MPMVQQYTSSMFARGVQLTPQQAMAPVAFARLGETWRGQEGIAAMGQVEKGLREPGTEAGQAMVYRALMGSGMSYYQATKAMQSGRIEDIMPLVMRQAKNEVGGGEMGNLAMSSLFGIPLERVEQLQNIKFGGAPSTEKIAKIEAEEKL